MNRNRMWALVFFLSGAALVFYGVGLMRDARACANWPTVQGRVLSAEAQVVGRQKDKTIYAPNVSYRYEVDGKEYESSRLTIVPRNYSSRQSVNEILASYAVGGNIGYFLPAQSGARSRVCSFSFMQFRFLRRIARAESGT